MPTTNSNRASIRVASIWDGEYTTDALGDLRKTGGRCSNPRCNRILFFGEMAPGSLIEIKCTRCRNLTKFQAI